MKKFLLLVSAIAWVAISAEAQNTIAEIDINYEYIKSLRALKSGNDL